MKIVLDTNVLIASFVTKGLSADVYDYCYVNHELFISEWILDELKEKLSSKLKFSDEKIVKIITLICESFTKLEIEINIPDICRDKDDNNILALAEEISADYIITGDKDLLVLEKYKTTLIVNPRKFWEKEKKI